MSLTFASYEVKEKKCRLRKYISIKAGDKETAFRKASILLSTWRK